MKTQIVPLWFILALLPYCLASESLEDCGRYTFNEYLPLCASDGDISITFANSHRMEVDNCYKRRKNRPEFRKIKDGACATSSEED